MKTKTHHTKRKASRSGEHDRFAEGYYCAVAVLAEMQGEPTTEVRELWAAGGYGEGAMPEDLVTLAKYNLKPASP